LRCFLLSMTESRLCLGGFFSIQNLTKTCLICLLCTRLIARSFTSFCLSSFAWKSLTTGFPWFPLWSNVSIKHVIISRSSEKGNLLLADAKKKVVKKLQRKKSSLRHQNSLMVLLIPNLEKKSVFAASVLHRQDNYSSNEKRHTHSLESVEHTFREQVMVIQRLINCQNYYSLLSWQSLGYNSWSKVHLEINSERVSSSYTLNRNHEYKWIQRNNQPLEWWLCSSVFLVSYPVASVRVSPLMDDTNTNSIFSQPFACLYDFNYVNKK
jgi:hypothetical protein